MNAIQFIQKHGVDKAREVIDGAPSNAESYQDGTTLELSQSFSFTMAFILFGI